ncbi:unnamed protein product [Cunninghamella blakesleeana]
MALSKEGYQIKTRNTRYSSYLPRTLNLKIDKNYLNENASSYPSSSSSTMADNRARTVVNKNWGQRMGFRVRYRDLTEDKKKKLKRELEVDCAKNNINIHFAEDNWISNYFLTENYRANTLRSFSTIKNNNDDFEDEDESDEKDDGYDEEKDEYDEEEDELDDEEDDISYNNKNNFNVNINVDINFGRINQGPVTRSKKRPLIDNDSSNENNNNIYNNKQKVTDCMKAIEILITDFKMH